MRVGILGLLQESNTFLPAQTSWDDFANETLARRDEVRDVFSDAQHEIGGFFEGLNAAGIEAVPLFVARALPFGTVASQAWDRLMEAMLDELRAESNLDGLLVAPHGATVSENYPDADGYWLSRVREVIGADKPMIGTLDPHANLSRQMVEACDALIAYRTNPHVDQRARGVEAAELMTCTLRRQGRPTMAAAFPPVAISIECQGTSESPCQELFALADEMLDRPEVFANSLLLGFPYADVREMGSSVIVVTDNNPAQAKQLANKMADALWRRREQLVGTPLGVEAAVRQACRGEPPVCLLDMGDNVGGGSPADGTWLAHALLHLPGKRSLVTLFDPPAVSDAKRAGVGALLKLSIGGRSGALNGQPLVEEFTVARIHDGKFTESQPRHGGYTSFDQGETAVLEAPGGLTIVATSRRIVPFSLAQITSCGIDPSAFDILVAKGVCAPIAAYQQVCRSFIRVGTLGYTCADMTSLDFKHRRRPMFPFEKDVQWTHLEEPYD